MGAFSHTDGCVCNYHSRLYLIEAFADGSAEVRDAAAGSSRFVYPPAG